MKPKYNIGDTVWLISDKKAVEETIKGVVWDEALQEHLYRVDEIDTCTPSYYRFKEADLYPSKEELIATMTTKSYLLACTLLIALAILLYSPLKSSIITVPPEAPSIPVTSNMDDCLRKGGKYVLSVGGYSDYEFCEISEKIEYNHDH